MKIRRLPLILVTSSFLVFSSFIAFYPNGAPAGYSGSPGDGKNCTECHGGTATSVTGWITSNIPVSGYVPGQTYQITATNNITGSGKYGFEVSPQNNAGTLLGTLAAGTNSQLVGGNKYITHTAASTSINTWTFNWTAPAAGTGDVTFYGAFAKNKPGPVRLSTLTVSEYVLTPPGPAGPIAGPNEVCRPVVSDYSVSPVTGATGYVWSVPAGATVISGQGTTSVSVNYGASAVSGDISVYGTNAAGSGTPSTLSVIVSHVAEVPATPSGPATVDLSLTTASDYSTTGSANADSYVWNLGPVSAGTISGNGLTATVQWGAFLGTASISVKAVNTCGESNWSQAFQTDVTNSTGVILKNAEKISVFPNPGAGMFLITLPSVTGQASPLFRVYDKAGNTVVSGLLEVTAGLTAVIDLTGKPAGLYFVAVQVNDKQYTGKIIIQ